MSNVKWDKINKGATVTISEDGFTVRGANQNNTARATEGKTTGKWYWEIEIKNISATMIGISNDKASLVSQSFMSANARNYYSNGQKYYPNGMYGDVFTTGDIISVLLDMDNGKLEFWKNGVSQGIAFTDILSMGMVFPSITSGSLDTSGECTANFGASLFVYSPPNDYEPYSKYSFATLKNPTTNQYYSLAEKTLIPLPDSSSKNMILHGIEAGKEIQLDVAFNRKIFHSNNVESLGNGKVFEIVKNENDSVIKSIIREVE